MLKKIKLYVIATILGIILLIQCCWMIHYHPFQSSYFNIIGKPFAQYFDREEWRLSSKAMFEWILRNEDGSFSMKGEYVPIYAYALPENEQRRISFEDGDANYIVNFCRNVVGNYVVYDGYEEVHTAWVDGDKVASVFKKKKAR